MLNKLQEYSLFEQEEKEKDLFDLLIESKIIYDFLYLILNDIHPGLKMNISEGRNTYLGLKFIAEFEEEADAAWQKHFEIIGYIPNFIIRVNKYFSIKKRFVINFDYKFDTNFLQMPEENIIYKVDAEFMESDNNNIHYKRSSDYLAVGSNTKVFEFDPLKKKLKQEGSITNITKNSGIF